MWDVRARAYTLAALGRWVAFGPSEDERLGTRWCTEPNAQSRMHFIHQTLFWSYFVFDPFFSVSIAVSEQDMSEGGGDVSARALHTLAALYVREGGGFKCTRSHVRRLRPVGGIRSLRR